jgi:hypothetical protein
MSQLKNKAVQIGAQNHKDDLEMDAFLEGEMKRIDLKRTLPKNEVFYSNYYGEKVLINDKWEVIAGGFVIDNVKNADVHKLNLILGGS